MHHLTGTLLVILAAVCFGFMGYFGSWAMRDGVSVEMLLFLRFAIAGVVMSAIMMVRGGRLPQRRILLGLVAMGGVLYVGEAMFFFHAMRHIPVGLVSLLLYIYPVLVTLFAWLVWKERLSSHRLIALALAVMGLLLTIGPTLLERAELPRAGARPLVGVALGLGCGVSYAIYILVGGAMTRRAGPMTGATVVIWSAAAVLGVTAFMKGDSLPHTPAAWAGVGLLALISTVVPITAVLVGLQRIGAVQTSTLSTLEPVVTVLVGALLMEQPLTMVQLVGGGLIVLAALIVARCSRPRSSIPTSAEVLEIH